MNIAKGQTVYCRVTGKALQVISIRGSWVGLYDCSFKRTVYLSTDKVTRSYRSNV